MCPATGGAEQLLRTAIAERRLVTFTLDGLRRVAEPHDYGIIDGVARLFFYQVGGESRSGRPVGWRWGLLPKISNLHVLPDRFAGPRAAPSGHHIQWDVLIATVSPRPVSEVIDRVDGAPPYRSSTSRGTESRPEGRGRSPSRSWSRKRWP